MNKLFIFTCLILVFIVSGCGDNKTANNQLFETSNKNMSDEKFAEALKGYQQLESAGVKTPALFTNMGALYFKMHHLGKAVQYFEKGLVIAPLDTELIYNRDKVQNKLTNQVDANNFSYNSGRQNFFKTLDILNMIVIIDVMICGLLFLFFLLKPSEQTRFYNAKTFRTVLAASVLILITISVVARIYESTSYAVVTTPEAVVYLGPSAQAKQVIKFNEGYKVEVLNKFDNWVEVKDFQGKSGWISVDKLGEI